MDRWYPDVAYCADRNKFLVVYAIFDPAGIAGQHVFGKLLPADLSGTSSISEIKFVYNTNVQIYPAVAAGNDEFLVVWQDAPTNLTLPPGTYYDMVYGRRLSGDGTLPGNPFAIADFTNEEYVEPRVAYSPGNGYVVPLNYHKAQNGDRDVLGNYVVSGSDSPYYSTPFTIDVSSTKRSQVYDIDCNASGIGVRPAL